MAKGKSRVGLLSVLYYALFIPTYIYFTYYAICTIVEVVLLGIDLNRFIVFVTTLYYPFVLFIYGYWAIKFKAQVGRYRGIESCILWIIGWVLISISSFVILILNV